MDGQSSTNSSSSSSASAEEHRKLAAAASLLSLAAGKSSDLRRAGRIDRDSGEFFDFYGRPLSDSGKLYAQSDSDRLGLGSLSDFEDCEEDSEEEISIPPDAYVLAVAPDHWKFLQARSSSGMGLEHHHLQRLCLSLVDSPHAPSDRPLKRRRESDSEDD